MRRGVLTHRAFAAILLFVISAIACLLFTAAYNLPAVQDDASDYLTLAQNVGDGIGFTQDGVTPAVYRPPMFSVLLGEWFRFTSTSSPESAAVFQSMEHGLAVALAFLLFFEASGFFAGSLAAAFFLALNPLLITRVVFVMQEPTIILFTTLAAWLSVRWIRTPSTGRAVLAGAAWGLCTLVKVVSWYVPILLLLMRWLPQRYRVNWKAKDAAALLLCFAAAIAPWTIRNYEQLHRFIPVNDQGGGMLEWNVVHAQIPGERPGAEFAAELDRKGLSDAGKKAALWKYVLDQPRYFFIQRVAQNAAHFSAPARDWWDKRGTSNPGEHTRKYWLLVILFHLPLYVFLVGRTVQWWQGKIAPPMGFLLLLYWSYWAQHAIVLGDTRFGLGVYPVLVGLLVPVRSDRSSFFTEILARHLSRNTRYFDLVVQYQPLKHDSGEILRLAEAPRKTIANDVVSLRNAFQSAAGTEPRTAVFLNGNLNYSFDIQTVLEELHGKLNRRSRLLILAYNPYWAWLHRIAERLGLRSAEVPWTFITHSDLVNLARLSGFEVVRMRAAGVFPFSFLGLGAALNKILEALPLTRRLAFSMLLVLRPLGTAKGRPSLSIVIPARDERGNIEAALQRLPDFNTDVEVIFVEGNSSDGTWEEIQSVAAREWKGLRIRAFKQPGKGKADAVDEGFRHCTNDVLTVLDADLTMPPELLPRFYEAYARGDADFVNGTRLVYPMEGEAMRSMNWLGNIFFAKALSFTLDVDLGDSLCGTKLFSRADYEVMKRWNGDFGKFDPFGDYEMLFPAAELGLGIVDVPVRYRARTYGSTKIRRFHDGFILLRMVAVGLWRIRLRAGR